MRNIFAAMDRVESRAFAIGSGIRFARFEASHPARDEKHTQVMEAGGVLERRGHYVAWRSLSAAIPASSRHALRRKPVPVVTAGDLLNVRRVA